MMVGKQDISKQLPLKQDFRILLKNASKIMPPVKYKRYLTFNISYSYVDNNSCITTKVSGTVP